MKKLSTLNHVEESDSDEEDEIKEDKCRNGKDELSKLENTAINSVKKQNCLCDSDDDDEVGINILDFLD